MKIGEPAKLSGLSASRIHFYEASGLLRTVERQAHGHRNYPPDVVSILSVIACAQAAGFLLDDIRHLLPITLGAGWHQEEWPSVIERKMVEIESLQTRLDSNKARLLMADEDIRNRPKNLGCVDRTQWVLDRLHERNAISAHHAVTPEARRSPTR
ncbi:MerR family transcriptional regulator [Dyella japonica]|uniref:MerR family transcriptional regulator n=1 Tax=Dyella japonica A8 TaxID=1217721 RepID=A0A075K2K2_9GAMM|nr:MerR family transcriptional regulator [Dyella japonica]AIF48120.1 MerR family transcriptional regulator [Dyella japonica A8]